MTNTMTKTQAVKTTRYTFYVQGVPMDTVYSPSTWCNDFDIETINGMPEDMVQDWVVGSVREQIRLHEYKATEKYQEYKSEQRGDEERGN